MTTNDLQPKPNTVTVQGKNYIVKPIKMSHRLILARLQPLFEQIKNVSEGKQVELTGKEMLALEEEIDTLITSLIPELTNVTLDMNDVTDLITQIIQTTIPEEAKELDEANIQVNQDPKVQQVG